MSRFSDQRSTKQRLEEIAKRHDLGNAAHRAQLLLRLHRKSHGRVPFEVLESAIGKWQRSDALAYRAEYPAGVLRSELRDASKMVRHGRVAYGPAMAYPYRLHSDYAAFEERTKKKSKSRRSR